MSSETHENNLLAERVEKLEKEMRRIKRIGILAAALLAVLFLVFRVVRYRQVSAEEFVLKDALGRQRAKLGFFPDGPGLEIYAASEEPRVELIGGGEEATLNLYIPVTTVRGNASVNFLHNATVVSSLRVGPDATLLEMRSAADSGTAALSLQGGSTSLTLNGVGEQAEKVSLQSDASRACATLGGAAPSQGSGSLCLHSPGLPALELTDLAGNRAVLGVTQTTNHATGKPQETSASSLVLEPKSGKTLYLPPR